MMKSIKTLTGMSLLMLGQLSWAAPHIAVMPNCLQAPADAKILAKEGGLSLLSVPETTWEKSVAQQKHTDCGKLMDVSNAWYAQAATPATFLKNYQHEAKPTNTRLNKRTQISYQAEIAELVQNVQPANIWQILDKLTKFPDRYAGNNFGGSQHGVEAQKWIIAQLQSMINNSGRKDASVFTIETRGRKNYAQSSILLRIGNAQKSAVIVGAHMDTLSGQFESKPGADDDGSGTSGNLEAARVILNSNQEFEHPIYFIWYAAEELGLVGSQIVVEKFKQFNIPVKAVVQFDMTGYVANDDYSIWLLDDYADLNIAEDLSELVKLYTDRPVKYTHCGYACSDHASWTLGGYPAAGAVESNFLDYNPYIHSVDDTLDRLSVTHMADFSRLAVAFAAHEAVIKPKS